MAETSEGPRVERTGLSTVGRVKEAVDKFVHKHLTLEGRIDTEKMKRMDRLHDTLSHLSPEQRSAIERKILTESKDAAVRSVVRDVAVVVGVAGSTGLAYWQRERIGNVVNKLGKRVPEGVKKPLNDTLLRTQIHAVRFQLWLQDQQKYATNFVGAMRAKLHRQSAPPYADWPHTRA